MSLKKSSSRVEGEHPSSRVVEKARGRIWDILPKSLSLGFRRGFKTLPGNNAKILSHKL
jgi:hypothetical protein